MINSPTIISQSKHGIPRECISDPAHKVLEHLNRSGFNAYLVGGCVRDLLLGYKPKDFDVATDATPEQVRELFPNSRLIGRRFRLAHVRFKRNIIEVSTFRAPPSEKLLDHNGRIVDDNIYGTLEQDAWRRDFSINALYYDIRTDSVIDYTGGITDLEKHQIRLIGNPTTRYQEDPVRMLRAVRFMCKLGFDLHPESKEAIYQFASTLQNIPPARLFEEVIKLFLSGYAIQAFSLLRHFGLFQWLFPETETYLIQGDRFSQSFLEQALINTDNRVLEEKPVTAAFLFAVFLWVPIKKLIDQYPDSKKIGELIRKSVETVSINQSRHITLPRRVSLPMKEIWYLQPRFKYQQGIRAVRLLQHPRFRAAYDFLLLRNQADEIPNEQDTNLCRWWDKVQSLEEKERLNYLNPKRSRSNRSKTKKIKPKLNQLVSVDG
ncbi:polynucleotide adenylyltransferase PcnB [Candidatus Nitrosacidococcus sp. I8]|uniref:polynucleotide adenylyltransferase PcnB n=1 Tax=Candidatus Nitrosacidococcus sp. I8 TaxID=2942908 RepID=UPI0029D41BE7|nr:polynucleotide adenylyltransferase PcnB [Candidatus Nitrosacidococcus sp. I8]